MLEATPDSIEAGKGAEPDASTQHNHGTRASRNGRAQVNYSAKWHPMDDTLRPKRAARITGSRSLYASMSCDREGEGEDETTDGGDDPELLSDDDTEPDQSDTDTPTSRLPDPRATRHSTRPEAQKVVNYSKAHHPQDHALPGFQHLAKRGKRSLASSSKRRNANRENDAIEISSATVGDSSEDDTHSGLEEIEVRSSPPRKRLKTLGRGERTPGARPKSSLPRDESSNRVDAIIRACHFAPLDDEGMGSLQGSGTEIIRDIGSYMAGVLDNVEDSTESRSRPATVTDTREQLSDKAPEKCTPGPGPLPTPTSLNIFRPYLSQVTRPNLPSSSQRVEMTGSSQGTMPTYIEAASPMPGEEEQQQHRQRQKDEERRERIEKEMKEDVVEKVVEDFKEEEEEEDQEEKNNGTHNDQDRLLDDLRQTARACSIEAAHYANARTIATRLSPSKSSDIDSMDLQEDAHSSRQSSRGTVPDDEFNSSSFFEDAISSIQPPRKDEDVVHPASNFARLPVSQRERSDGFRSDSTFLHVNQSSTETPPIQENVQGHNDQDGFMKSQRPHKLSSDAMLSVGADAE